MCCVFLLQWGTTSFSNRTSICILQMLLKGLKFKLIIRPLLFCTSHQELLQEPAWIYVWGGLWVCRACWYWRHIFRYLRTKVETFASPCLVFVSLVLSEIRTLWNCFSSPSRATLGFRVWSGMIGGVMASVLLSRFVVFFIAHMSRGGIWGLHLR